MVKKKVVSIMLLNSLGCLYGMEPSGSTISERYRNLVVGCLVLAVTGLTLKKMVSYYVPKKSLPVKPLQDKCAKYKSIREALTELKVNIEYGNKSLLEFEKERIALLQAIVPEVVLEHKTEQEIHDRLMQRLCPTYTSLALAIGDVNRALLDLKKKEKLQHEQQYLNQKEYVL